MPKEPSTDPRVKRLAIETEDHPLAYADFEAVIPHGEYGAGTVLVWDRGTYRKPGAAGAKTGEDCSMQTDYDSGHLRVRLEGEKLRRGYALTRFRSERGRSQWLQVKTNDAAADARRNPTSTQPRSVISGRTLTEIARSGETPER